MPSTKTRLGMYLDPPDRGTALDRIGEIDRELASLVNRESDDDRRAWKESSRESGRVAREIFDNFGGWKFERLVDQVHSKGEKVVYLPWTEENMGIWQLVRDTPFARLKRRDSDTRGTTLDDIAMDERWLSLGMPETGDVNWLVDYMAWQDNKALTQETDLRSYNLRRYRHLMKEHRFLTRYLSFTGQMELDAIPF
jgi:hypothetical protein